MRLAHVGNHSSPATTESYVAAALESLGHVVERHQENTTDWPTLAERIDADGCQLVFWTRTPSYGIEPASQRRFVEECRRRGIVTCGLHLDRYWDLAREPEITTHPWWRQDHIYTADGGNQERFAEVGVAHRWWRPAISASQCGRGRVDPRYTGKVAFVGSHRYHPEWPWRRQLLQHMERTFRGDFVQYGRSGQRLEDHQLADAYATVPVIVGDSCFADRQGTYWSNRIVETLGRGGFLIHPRVKGIEEHYADGEHLVLYDVGDARGLIALIRQWLPDSNGRQRISEAGMRRVMERDTFEVRMAEVLSDLFEDHPHLRPGDQWLRALARGSADRAAIDAEFDDDVHGIDSVDLRGKTVIDINAGIGAFALHAAGRGAQVIAAATDPGDLAILRKSVKDSGADVEVVEASPWPVDRWLAEAEVELLRLEVPESGSAVVGSATRLGRARRIEMRWTGHVDLGAIVTTLAQTHLVTIDGVPDRGGLIHAVRRA